MNIRIKNVYTGFGILVAIGAMSMALCCGRPAEQKTQPVATATVCLAEEALPPAVAKGKSCNLSTDCDGYRCSFSNGQGYCNYNEKLLPPEKLYCLVIWIQQQTPVAIFVTGAPPDAQFFLQSTLESNPSFVTVGCGDKTDYLKGLQKTKGLPQRQIDWSQIESVMK